MVDRFNCKGQGVVLASKVTASAGALQFFSAKGALVPIRFPRGVQP